MARSWKVDMIFDLHKYMDYMDRQMEMAEDRMV
jgi:hypothetical protein